uniref:Argonaute Ast1 variant n=1 Tax=Apis mellifera TaxID=7460 RepID=C9E0S9_APIME|nr:argonaute Ast1 variant [Apis mellifera]
MEADKQFGKGRGSILLKLLKEKEKVENEEILQGISSTLNASNNAKESKNQTEFNLQSVIEIPSSSTIGRGRASLLQILKEMKSSETLQSKPIQTISSGRGSLLSRLKATSLNETSLQQPNIAKNSSDDAGVVGKLSDITIQENKPKSEASCKPMSHQGTEGEPIQLGANYINLKLDPAKGLFNYEVKFNPDIDSRPLRRKLLNQHVQALGRTKVFDGVTLYLPQKLKQDVNLFTSIHPMDESKVELKVIYKKQQSISENIPFFNVLLGRVMRALSLVRIGQHSFNPKGIHCVPQHKLEVWPGYVTAINEYDGGLKLCIDARHRVMRTETVRDIMMKFGGKPNFKDIIIRELIGLSVFTRYNNKTYRIDDIAWDKNPTYELCYLASLSDSIRSDFRVMKDLDSLTKMSPNARCDVFRHFVEQVRSNSVPREILSEWGLELESDIAEFTGRVFGPEQIQFANTKFIPPPAKPAEWSSAVCRNTVLRTPNLNHWCVLYCQKDTRCTQEFVGMLKNVAKVIGMNVREPQMICLRDDRIETYVQALKKNIDQTVNLMVIVFPTNRTDRYSAVKRVCCVEMPVPSQVIMSRTISRGDKLKSITEKIALQINCKLGGALWALAIPMDHCMICGIDVYHAGVGQSMKGSVAGFVASLDKLLTSWHSKICLQGKHQELVDILQICLISAIKAYYRRNKRYPDRIIVYRDGVGDGQLDTVAKYEVKQLLATFKTIEINYQPTLTVIVVQKRINTRLFEISSTD